MSVIMENQTPKIKVSPKFYSNVIELVDIVQEIIKEIDSWQVEFVDEYKLRLAERICADIEMCVENGEE